MAYEVDHHGNLSSREGEVNRLLNGPKKDDALKLALSNPPYGCADNSVKDRSYGLVFQCVQTIKDPKVVSSLTPEECDALIKYIYRGLATDDTNGSPDPLEKNRRMTTCALLLSWHAALKDFAGLGVLVRATTGYPL